MFTHLHEVFTNRSDIMHNKSDVYGSDDLLWQILKYKSLYKWDFQRAKPIEKSTEI